MEVEAQQLKQIKEEQAEHAVIRTANDTDETAKEVKAIASQTDKPLIIKTESRSSQSQIATKSSYAQSAPASVKSTGSQSQIATKSTSSQASPQIFDMTVNDNMSKFKQDIESVEDTQLQNKLQQEQRMTRILQNHLQDEATHDTTIGFAHKLASLAGSGLKKVGSVASSTFSQLSSSSSQEPTNTLLLGDGRGKQDYYVMNSPRQIPKRSDTPKGRARGPQPMEIDDALEKSKPKAKNISAKTMTVNEQELFDEIYENIQPKSKPKPKPKSKTMTAEEQELFDGIYENIQPKSKPTPKPKTKPPPPPKPKPPPPLKPKPTPTTKTTTIKNPLLKTKSSVTTGVQIPPSKIGIQKLREELENAKNKNTLSVADVSEYMKLYDEWKGAKGNVAMKLDKINGLRALYKRTLYKKVG